ncbi:MAG: hypothetical protein LLF94_05145 [Chlamydiales bacterium]|nr:hypothetical protein [Chlamydiales bacterium]
MSDDDSIEIKAIRRELLKQKAHEGVSFIEDMPKNYEDIIFDVGAFFAHKLIDQF